MPDTTETPPENPAPKLDATTAVATLQVYVIEYDKLKTEQAQRIQFRDNLLIAHLTTIEGVISFILSKENKDNPRANASKICFSPKSRDGFRQQKVASIAH